MHSHSLSHPVGMLQLGDEPGYGYDVQVSISGFGDQNLSHRQDSDLCIGVRAAKSKRVLLNLS
jgi:hypothetical protein